MKLKKILSSVIAAAMVLSTASFNVLASDTDIYEVGVGELYETLAAAAAVATDDNNDGEITYHIYGKLEISDRGWLNYRGKSGATTINFVGKTEDAEIAILNNAETYIATDGIKDMEAINYTDLILSRPNGGSYGNDGAHANYYFTSWMRGAVNGKVTYNNCVFPNGTCNNQYAKTEYNYCTFNNPKEYGLWIYSSDGTPETVTIVNYGTFEAKKGVKIYSEDKTGVAIANTTISNSTFNIESKPAIVSSTAGVLAIEKVDATACQYGLLSTEYKDHVSTNPNYSLATVTVDGEEPEYVALVNGELHTSLAYAEEENRGTIETPVAKINGKYYASLEAAFEAAVDGDTITLLAGTYPAFTVPTDKNNLTIAGVTDADGNNLVTIETLNKDFVTTPGVSWVNGYCVHAKAETVTFRNLNFTAGVSASAPWYFGSITSGHNDYDSSNGNNNLKNLIIDKCNFIGSGSHYAVWVNDGNVTVSDSTISGYQLGIDNYAMGANEVMNISNTTITNVNNPFHTGDAVAGAQINVTDSVIDSNVIHVGGAVAVNVTDSKISNADVETWSTSSINISESSLYNTTYKVNDNSAITLNKNYADNVNELVVLASADEKITYETYYKTEEDLKNGNLTVLPDKAETIYVQFRNTNPDAEDMANSVWEIVLVGDEEIHELASVDLTFENNSKLAADTTKENPYTIAAKAGMTLSKKGDNRYMFSFDANTVEETDTEILLGTITFGGYGELDFKVDATATTDNQNIANATEIANSIVETFVVGGATDSDDKTGALVINTDAPDALDKEGNLVGVIGGTSVEVPSRNLKINVTFPNAVEDNVIAYQDMVVTVKGTNVATSKVDTFTYNLGEDDGNAMDSNGNYVIENIKLSQNGTYTVTVTGAGYRTVSYDVHMTDDKELTFWNNVMDAPKVVEKDNADSAETVTFLAGDIVKDDNINIYDLSAVVSYFATKTTTTGYDEKAQYDLNRDGMIDSKDVAYVLVSWGK